MSETKKHDDEWVEGLEITMPSDCFNAEKLALLGRTIHLQKEETAKPENVKGAGTFNETLPNLDESSFSCRASTGKSFPKEEITNRYAIRNVLGSGSSGNVYNVYDYDLKREIAVKVLKAKKAQDNSQLQNFLREAEMTARLEHPNILPIYDIDMNKEGHAFFTMRKACGYTLGSALQNAKNGDPLPPELREINDRINVFQKICEAVAFAHYKGIIHQDIKPNNIMVGSFGEVVLVDWGTAYSPAEADLQGCLVGTPAYMSPEQARREKADERSDIYCLGATLFQILTLRYPTWADNPESFWSFKYAGILTPLPDDLEKSVPPLLLAIARKAMSALPDDRYTSVKEMQHAIEEFRMHAESITITNACIAELDGAERDGVYEQFVDMLGDLRNALRIWPGNTEALEVQKRARRSYAECALSKNDLELASSIIGSDTTFDDIRGRIREARRIQEIRSRQFRIVRIGSVVLGAVVVVCLAYFVFDYFRYFGSWQLVYDKDFVKDTSALHSLAFVNVFAGSPFIDKDHGLTLTLGTIGWLRDVHVENDVRVEAEVEWVGDVDGLEIHINAQNAPVSFAACPVGYVCQFGGFGGNTNLISRNETSQYLINNGGIYTSFKPWKRYRCTFMRKGEVCFLFVNGKEVYRDRWLLPLQGEDLDGVAIRTWSKNSVRIRSLRVWRMVLPQKTTPIIIGDVAVRSGNMQLAVKNYLMVSKDYSGKKLGELALAKAYLSSCQFNGTLHDTLLRSFQASYPQSSLLPMLLEIKCLTTWRSGQYEEALHYLEQIYNRNHTTRIAVDLLNSRMSNVPRPILKKLLSWVGRCMVISNLDISGLQVDDLYPIRNLKLSWLNCGGNGISDLSPLRGMSLQYLLCSNNKITRLDALRGMPVRQLNCENNQICSLEPLKGIPLCKLTISLNPIQSLNGLCSADLQTLSAYKCQLRSIEALRAIHSLVELGISNNVIADISPLSGNKLITLDCAENKITDISALKDMPLKSLCLGGNPVSDFSVVKGMKLINFEIYSCPAHNLDMCTGMDSLQNLNCSGTGVSDISPLAGCPLVTLKMNNNIIQSLDPLSGITTLRNLFCTNNKITSLLPLKNVPLTFLDCRGNPITDIAPFDENPPETFHFNGENITDNYFKEIEERWRKSGSVWYQPNIHYLQMQRFYYRHEWLRLKETARCFNGHRYLLIDQDLPWNNADSVARAMGAHLVSLNSMDESRFVSVFLNECLKEAWIGLGGPDFSVWTTGEPVTVSSFVQSPSGSKDKAIRIFSDKAIQWWLQYNKSYAGPFIVEWDN